MLSFFRWLSTLLSGPVDPPRIHLEPSAVQEFEAVAHQVSGHDLADNYIRLGKDPQARRRFSPTITFVPPEEVRPDHDFVVESGGVKLVVDRRHAQALDGTVISFLDAPGRRGFQFAGPAFN